MLFPALFLIKASAPFKSLVNTNLFCGTISIRSFSFMSEKSLGNILVISVSSGEALYTWTLKGSNSEEFPLISLILIVFLLGLNSLRAFSRSFLSTIIFGPVNLIYLFAFNFFGFLEQINSSFVGLVPLYVVFSGSDLFSSILFNVSSNINISLLFESLTWIISLNGSCF